MLLKKGRKESRSVFRTWLWFSPASTCTVTFAVCALTFARKVSAWSPVLLWAKLVLVITIEINNPLPDSYNPATLQMGPRVCNYLGAQSVKPARSSMILFVSLHFCHHRHVLCAHLVSSLTVSLGAYYGICWATPIESQQQLFALRTVILQGPPFHLPHRIMRFLTQNP